jgi:hypothetical protein
MAHLRSTAGCKDVEVAGWMAWLKASPEDFPSDSCRPALAPLKSCGCLFLYLFFLEMLGTGHPTTGCRFLDRRNHRAVRSLLPTPHDPATICSLHPPRVPLSRTTQLPHPAPHPPPCRAPSLPHTPLCLAAFSNVRSVFSTGATRRALLHRNGKPPFPSSKEMLR